MKRLASIILAGSLATTLTVSVAAANNTQYHCGNGNGNGRVDVVFMEDGAIVCNNCNRIDWEQYSNGNSNGNDNVQYRHTGVPAYLENETEEVEEVWTLDEFVLEIGEEGLWKHATGQANTLAVAYSITAVYSSNLGGEKTEDVTEGVVTNTGLVSGNFRNAVVDFSVSGTYDDVDYDIAFTSYVVLENRAASKIFSEYGEKLVNSTITTVVNA